MRPRSHTSRGSRWIGVDAAAVPYHQRLSALACHGRLAGSSLATPESWGGLTDKKDGPGTPICFLFINNPLSFSTNLIFLILEGRCCRTSMCKMSDSAVQVHSYPEVHDDIAVVSSSPYCIMPLLQTCLVFLFGMASLFVLSRVEYYPPLDLPIWLLVNIYLFISNSISDYIGKNT